MAVRMRMHGNRWSSAFGRLSARLESFRETCEALVATYDGTDEQHYADWAREAIRLIDEQA